MKRAFLVVSFFVIFIPAAVRYNIGTDYAAYIKMFEDVRHNQERHGEVGYTLVVKILQLFTSNPQSIIAFMSFFTLLFVYKYCTLSRDYIIVIPAFFLIYYSHSYNIVRQVFAVALGLYALRWLYEGYVRKALFLSFITLFFHTSGILLFLYVLIASFLPLSQKTSFIYAFILFLMFYVFDFSFVLIQIAGFTRYAAYLTTGYMRKTKINSGLGVFIYFLMSVFELIALKRNEKKSSIARWGLVSFLFFYFVGTKVFILNRFRDLFMVVLIPPLKITHDEERNTKGRFFLFILYFLFFLKFISMLMVNQNAIIPYEFIRGLI